MSSIYDKTQKKHHLLFASPEYFFKSKQNKIVKRYNENIFIELALKDAIADVIG